MAKYNNKDTEKPRIYIFLNNYVRKDSIKDMFLGIEEEGIPFQIRIFEDFDSKKLAYMASDASLLGVGIGIDKKNIILHHEKLEPYKCVFSISLDSESKMLRELGESAARIVKKVPFKNKYL